MDRQAASELGPYLARDETLLWSGRPDRLRYATAELGPPALLAALFLVSLLGIVAAMSFGLIAWRPSGVTGLALAIFSLPFLYLSMRALLTPFERYREAALVAYGLTDRRAVFLTGGTRSRIEEMAVERIASVERRAHAGGLADVTMRRSERHKDGGRELTFIAVAGAGALAGHLDKAIPARAREDGA